MAQVIELSEWKTISGGISFLKWLTDYYDKNDKYKDRLPAQNRHNMQNQIDNRLRLVFSIGIYYYPVPNETIYTSEYVCEVVNIKTVEEYKDSKESIITHIGENTAALFEYLMKIIPNTRMLNKIQKYGWGVIDEVSRYELCEAISDAYKYEDNFRHYLDYALFEERRRMRETLKLLRFNEVNTVFDKILRPDLYSAICAYDNMKWYYDNLDKNREFSENEKLLELINELNCIIDEIRKRETELENSLIRLLTN